MRELILALVAESSGMVFAPNRSVEADAGIARAMKRRGSPDLVSYLRLLRADGKALEELVDELTVVIDGAATNLPGRCAGAGGARRIPAVMTKAP